jgi:hypothetical protein
VSGIGHAEKTKCDPVAEAPAFDTVFPGLRTTSVDTLDDGQPFGEASTVQFV